MHAIGGAGGRPFSSAAREEAKGDCGYAKAVRRNIEKIQTAAEGVKRLGIGGTATGTGLNAHPEYHQRMVEELGKYLHMKLYESDNLFESMNSMQDAVFFSGAIRSLAQDLIRIANDFRLSGSVSASATTRNAESFLNAGRWQCSVTHPHPRIATLIIV